MAEGVSDSGSIQSELFSSKWFQVEFRCGGCSEKVVVSVSGRGPWMNVPCRNCWSVHYLSFSPDGLWIAAKCIQAHPAP